MKTNQKRSSRTLDWRDDSFLVLGTGMAYWTPEEWERLRAVWAVHGEAIIERCRADGGGPPMFLWETDKPRAERLMEEYRARHSGPAPAGEAPRSQSK